VVHFDGPGTAMQSLQSSRTTFCAPQESWDSFAGKIREAGAVVEELLRGPGVVSPSVQLRITPGGVPRVVSTHDQVLGGPNDQVYLGCRFPADARYRETIQEAAMAAADVLAANGVIGFFGIDFFAVPVEGGFRVFLAEINLRVGGTTHPFGMAALASDGDYHAGSGEMRAAGRTKCYVSTDNLKSARLAGMAPEGVIRLLDHHGVLFDHATRTGTTLHLLGALREHGKMGVTCVGDSPEEAEERYREIVATLASS
jgi:PGM1 C-terminal domain